MGNFKQAVSKIFELEGGFQDFPSDTGNYNSIGQLVGTNWGISAPVYESWLQRPPTLLDMKNMPKSVAESIYKSRFWDKIKGDQVNPQYLAEIIFDGAVNHGVSRGVKLLQEVLRINPDGVMGNETLSAISQSNPVQLHDAYKQRRIEFYYSLASSTPSYQAFLNGWINRVNSFIATSDLAPFILMVAAAIWFFSKKKKKRYAYSN